MAYHSWQRTKIVCTLGPATDPPGVIEKLIACGMDTARVNTSHGSHAEHARRIQLVRQAAQAVNQPVAILIDLPGPKYRLGDLPNDFFKLVDDSIITLTYDDSNPKLGNNHLPIRNRKLLESLHTGESVYLADGSIELSVINSHIDSVENGVTCKVLTGGIVRSGSGINVPELESSGMVPTEEDRLHLKFALSQKVEWIAVSFVQSADDIIRTRACFDSETEAIPLVIVKIEKRLALENLNTVIEASDGVMVARGDLGVETDLAKIAIVQKQIITSAIKYGRPVITATQMLDSMVEHEHPTRAEVTDVANAVLDGTDAVMLSNETAIGKFPIAAIRYLNRVLSATEKKYSEQMAKEQIQLDMISSLGKSDDALSIAVCLLASRSGARAIIVQAHTISTVLAIARFRPQAPIVVVADSIQVYRGLALVRGVSPLLSMASGVESGLQDCVAQARDWICSQGLASLGDQAVLVSASSNTCQWADTLQIIGLHSEGKAG